VKAALLVQKIYRCQQARKVTNQLRARNLANKESEYSIGDWAVVKDSTGNHEYYVNQHTGQAAWELPDVEEWDSHQYASNQYQSSKTHAVSFDGAWELNVEDVKIHRKSKYAVESQTAPKRRKSVMRPDGTWIEISMPS
jgi:hypothetical protein